MCPFLEDSLAVAAGREVASEERGALEPQGIEPSLHSPRSDARRPAWSQIGVKAGADYQGDGLAVGPTPRGAGLRCVFQRLEGEATREGPLRVKLDVAGAKAEPLADGARLVLENSGRRIAYSRLRVTDTTGKELTARMEVDQSNSESRKQKAEMSQPSAPALVVVVNDAEAVYPVRIDPTFSDANWISMNPSIPGADSQVNAAVVDGSGNLYIGGDFTFVGDVFANYIAKWNGSSWSALGSGMDSDVRALVEPLIFANLR